MDIINDISINLLPKDKDRVIITLLVSSVSQTKMNTLETVRLRLENKYGDNLTEEIINAELDLVKKRFEELQYEVLADMISLFSCTDSEAKQANEETNTTVKNTFETLKNVLVNLATEISNNGKLDQLKKLQQT